MTYPTAKLDYTVRESKRAMQVILKVWPRTGLEVVVPRGFNRALLPEILDAKKAWIRTQLGKLRPASPLVPPGHIILTAIGERWDIQYRPSGAHRVSVSEHPPSGLVVEGDIGEVSNVREALTRWLHRQAHLHLVPWLRWVSGDVEIPFQKTSVRGQATRWASCSQAHNISLNRNLLFLPGHLVRQVFLHELAHIKQPNHSPKFWAVVEELEPGYKNLEAQVKMANDYVPRWASPLE